MPGSPPKAKAAPDRQSILTWLQHAPTQHGQVIVPEAIKRSRVTAHCITMAVSRGSVVLSSEEIPLLP